MQKNTIERKIDWFIQLVLIAVGDFGHGWFGFQYRGKKIEKKILTFAATFSFQSRTKNSKLRTGQIR